MQRQTRFALVVVVAALALGVVALHRHNAALEQTLHVDAGGTP